MASQSLPKRYSLPQVVAMLAVILTVSHDTATAATIVKGAVFRVSGYHTFAAVPSTAGTTVRWWVDRVEIDEARGTTQRYARIDSAVGLTVTFTLVKIYQQHTIYRIYAEDSGIIDSATVQVFLSNNIFSLVYEGPNNQKKPVRLFIVVPYGQSASTRVVLVMHGLNRNASDYIVPWRDYAIRNNVIAIAPEFHDTSWPGTRSYHQGNMFTSTDGKGSPIPEPQWAFSLVQEIFEWTRSQFALADSLYDIWGHSAGAQFVHRMMLFKPRATIRLGIASNGGLFTVPDSSIIYPWGTQHSLLSIGYAELLEFTRANLIIHRGTGDTLRDANLPKSAMDDTQGRNRYERAGYFYNKGLTLNPECNWKLLDVPNVGHDYRLMSPPAQAILASSLVSVRAAFGVNQSISWKLHQNYPNPFNPETEISFALPEQSLVKLIVLDVLGRELATLIDGERSAGYHRIRWNGSDASGNKLGSGIYFYRITATGESGKQLTKVMKMLMAK